MHAPDPTRFFPPLGKPNWAARLLRRLGWQIELVTPPGPKFVLVVYPHTSNWDFPLGLLYRFACKWPIHWVGKQAMFRWPMRGLMRLWGGIPIDRSAPSGFIDGLVAEFNKRDHLLVTIAPEGTRKHVGTLKSGFYRLALAAKVPIGLGYIDYGRRQIGIAGYFMPSGDQDADLDILQKTYADKRAYYPKQAGEIKFR